MQVFNHSNPTINNHLHNEREICIINRKNAKEGIENLNEHQVHNQTKNCYLAGFIWNGSSCSSGGNTLLSFSMSGRV
jgi:hypothetical protein